MRTGHRRLAAAVLLGLTTAVLWTGTSAGADILCTTDQTGVTIAGNVIVPPGGVCRLTNSTVQGNVTVQPGGFFESMGSTIQGTVYASDATARLWDSTVAANVIMIRPTSVFPNITAAIVRNTKVGGSVTVMKANGPTPIVIGCGGCGTNTITGNLVVTQNVLPEPYSIFVMQNVVGGTLSCTGNSPAPTVADNVVTGATVGQCAGP